MLCGATKRSAKIIDILMKAGADIDAKDGSGRTALALAVEYGTKETIKALLAAGANVLTRDDEGRTVLDYRNRGLKGDKEMKARVREMLKSAYEKAAAEKEAAGTDRLPGKDAP